MSWLNRFLPARALDAIPVEGAHVDVEVVVTSPDVLTSPIAPTRAAAIQWYLLENMHDSGDRGATLWTIASGWRGPPLLVRWSTKTIEIPLEGVRLHPAYFDPNDGSPLHGEAAVVYGEVLQRIRTRGLVHVREHPLTHGQRLRMKAFVIPSGPARGGFREAPSEPAADLRAVRAVHLYD